MFLKLLIVELKLRCKYIFKNLNRIQALINYDSINIINYFFRI